MKRHWLKFALFALIVALVAIASPGRNHQASALSTGIVISQVYGGGGNGGATYTHDFVELFNRGSSAVSLDGWSIQYAATTGVSWTNKVDLPNVSVQPGQYYLVQLATGGSNGVALPAADLTGGINMGGSAGKVALMNTTTVISSGTSCPTTGVIDLVGYGPGTNCSETAPTTPNLSATTAAIRAGNGCTETDNNSTDFSNGTPNPRNTSTAFNVCGSGGITLSINDVSLAEGNAGTTSFQFTVSLSAPAPAGGVTFDIATADGTATAPGDYATNTLTGQSIAQGNTTYNFTVLVNGDTTPEANETFFVNVTNVTGDGVTVADGQGLGTIVNDDVTIVPIHDVQGNGTSSPIVGQTVSIEGIVVGDYQTQGSGQLLGFFIQEEDGDVDADPATSEGLFVYCTTCPVDVNVGDEVRVTGSVSEFFNMTQITAATVPSVSVLSTGNDLPSPTTVQLPVPGVPAGNLATATAAINAYFEQFEGMLVEFPDTLTVSEYFELARYGQVILTEGGREQTFTNDNTPTEAGYINHRINLASRTIILDDTDNRQNRPVDPDPPNTPNTPYFHPQPGLSITNYFRGGDTITDLTGVLHWSFNGLTDLNDPTDAWRLRPVVEEYDYEFTPVNLRPEMPEVEGDVIVASFNVLNYFLTIDTTSSNSSGNCGANQLQDCRGADSEAERLRQRAKILAALTEIDADVFGFMEMENTPGVEPLADLVAGLSGYDYIDTGVIGTDAIRVGIIYKTATVEPVGDYELLDSSVDSRFDDSRNRPALAQTFKEIATGERFTVVVNHLKSKGCGNPPNQATGDDADQGDGQSCWNPVRTAAAEAMADWLATDPTGSGDPDFLIIGDLNSYAMEDPIVALQDAGYTDLVAEFGGPGAYGYVFDGQLGYLDHALANETLFDQVADTVMWHINADEIPLFDYNDEIKDAGEATFEEESDVLPLYEANEFRSSDHDPVIVGLDLGEDESDTTPPETTITGNPPNPTNNPNASFTFTGTDAEGTVVGFECRLDGGGWSVCTSPQSYNGLSLGSHTFEVRAEDNAGNVDPTPASYTWTIDTSAPPSDAYYLVTTTAAGNVDGTPFDKNDILLYDGEDWSVYFDGVAAGLPAKADLTAIHAWTPFDVLMSFKQNKVAIPGFGPVFGHDIVSYYQGNWSLFFDGSDVGLTTGPEKLDGIHVLPASAAPIPICDHYLLISTRGPGRVPAYGGGNIKFSGEDVLGFCATGLGDNTSGHWFMVLDGSAEGVKKNAIESISANDDGTLIYLTTKAAFNVDSAVGGHSMVYVYDTITGEFSGPIFSAPAEGLNKKVDGLHVGFIIN